MKKTDLYKNLALKIENQMKQAGTPDRFAQGEVLDRKAQRKLDQSQGLIPFAVKLNQDLVNELRTLATQRGVAVRDYLTQQKLPLDRLFLGATKVAPPDDKWKPRADLSLSMR